MQAISDLLITLAAVGFVLGVMILVHEFGHYAVAKLCGVRVEVFSLGFGKRLWGFRRGDTDYRISALPLGGYVKMSGESPMEATTGDPGEFMSHPRWQRFLIAIAGPAMNILLAIGLLAAVFMLHYEREWFLDQPSQVGWVVENSPAARAGLKPGDTIQQIDGITNPAWEDTRTKIALSANQPMPLLVKRGDDTLKMTLVPDAEGPSHIGEAGVYPAEPIIVNSVEAGMPAAKAGMKVGDQIVAINGVKLYWIDGLLAFLEQNKTAPVQVTALRNGQQMTFAITPVLTEVQPGHPQYRIGFGHLHLEKVEKLPFPQALRSSLEQNKKYSLLMVELVQKMLERKVSVKLMDGPISIAKYSGEAVRQPGWTPLLMFMAAISLNLGIFNLFPIPILDGGVILLLLIEGLMRRDISLHIKERIYQAAFVFLVLFAAMVIFNDLTKTLPGLSKLVP
jgi:regulator of sigma E protease